jgi:cytochrome c oxidase cbb3-type subunit 3
MNAPAKIAMLVAITLIAGCGKSTRESTANAAPRVRTAVGPIPGPHTGASAPAKNPFGDDPTARADGRKWFDRFNCSGCHGGHAGGGMGPSLRDVDWLYGSSDEAVFSSIAEGRGKGMPAWGGRIPDEEIWKLVSYIRSLRTASEPDPPT